MGELRILVYVAKNLIIWMDMITQRLRIELKILVIENNYTLRASTVFIEKKLNII